MGRDLARLINKKVVKRTDGVVPRGPRPSRLLALVNPSRKAPPRPHLGFVLHLTARQSISGSSADARLRTDLTHMTSQSILSQAFERQGYRRPGAAPHVLPSLMRAASFGGGASPGCPGPARPAPNFLHDRIAHWTVKRC